MGMKTKRERGKEGVRERKRDRKCKNEREEGVEVSEEDTARANEEI